MSKKTSSNSQCSQCLQKKFQESWSKKNESNILRTRDEQMHLLTFSGSKNQLIGLTQHLELYQYSAIIWIQQWPSGQFFMTHILSYFILYLVNKTKNEPPMIKKGNDLVSLSFGNIQLLKTLKLLSPATSSVFFLQAYKANEMKVHFRYEWGENILSIRVVRFYQQGRWTATTDVWSFLKQAEKQQNYRQNSGWFSQYWVKWRAINDKLGLKHTSTRLKNYNYLTSICKKEKMTAFWIFVAVSILVKKLNPNFLMMISNKERKLINKELRKKNIWIQENSIEEVWECRLCDQFKNKVEIKSHVRTCFPSRTLFLSIHYFKNYFKLKLNPDTSAAILHF